MKKIFLVMLMVLMFITACSGKEVSNKENAPGVTNDSVKIGAWLPLTGPAAVYGTTQRAGIEAYFEMLNSKGGVKNRKIEFKIEDGGRDPQQTVAAAKKLIGRDNVFAIVNSFGTANTEATFSYVLDEQNVPVLNVFGGLLNWWQPARENLYGVMVPYEDQTFALGRWAAKEGAKNILVVHNDPAVYVAEAEMVPPGAKTIDPNVQVNLMPVKLGTTDYTPIALEAVNSKPDAIVLVQPIDEVVAFAKALDRQNVKIPLYTFAANVTQDTLKLGGKAVDGLHGVSWTVPPTHDSPAVEEYRQALKKHDPKSIPDFQSLYTWAESMIFAEVLNQVEGDLTRESFIKALENLKDYKTDILPPVTFSSENHMGGTAIQRVKVENGKWKAVGDFIEPTSNWE
ncbi:ABC transporter substrate-binding protein [Bacillus sp. OK048]|uniref:ABC transporter substrate-binding protein n=1 Tax=Bacillus sp. OK048 TaxID=1882761 RepID=UPI000881EE09|nr:ABC transporter substrate-binding protein [Bacillus sp. OK048]SDN30929.1 amino acid/amide ABC transporter substrate-binding protein, HAAT family [Bacillus sp. OK048]